MTLLDPAQVKSQLASYQHPRLPADLAALKAIKSVRLDGEQVHIELSFGFPCQLLEAELKADMLRFLQDDGLHVTISSRIRSHANQPGAAGLDKVKNVIAVASGKGGVGKSTTAVNLALALQQQGAKVGLLDADIYGPNQAQMLGSTDAPNAAGKEHFVPVERYGLQTMSMAYLVDNDTPMVWRGPMVSKVFRQIALFTHWQDLDYLIIDLPPGTGDVQLTLSKQIPVSGAVIVTTPQDVALLDARKGIEMFRKVSVPVLGVVENMSTHVCSQCGHEEHLFGADGGKQLAASCDVSLLGQIPLALPIREAADAGKPIVLAQPQSAWALAYQQAALTMAARLSMQKINYANKLPNVVVESAN